VKRLELVCHHPVVYFLVCSISLGTPLIFSIEARKTEKKEFGYWSLPSLRTAFLFSLIGFYFYFSQKYGSLLSWDEQVGTPISLGIFILVNTKYNQLQSNGFDNNW